MNSKKSSVLNLSLKKVFFVFFTLSFIACCFGLVFLVNSKNANNVFAASEITLYGGNGEEGDTNSWHYRIRQKFGDAVISQTKSIDVNVSSTIESGAISGTPTNISSWAVIGDGLYGYYSSSTNKITFSSNGVNAKIFLPQNSNYLFSYYNQSYAPSSLQTINGMQNFETTNVTRMTYMFYGCTSLTDLDVSGFNTENVTSMCSMFYNCSSLKTLDVSNFNTSKVVNFYAMFGRCMSITELDVSNFDTSRTTTMAQMFKDCKQLKKIDVSNFKTGKVGDMDSMFQTCLSLESIDISNFDTRLVAKMSSMFDGCEKLQAIDVESFVTSNVSTMSYMFNGCASIKSLDISSFNTQLVEDMSHMFCGCKELENLTFNVDTFVTDKVSYMDYMFDGCEKLSSIDVSNFNTENIKSFRNMFSSCKLLETISVENFDTSSAKNFRETFKDCSKLQTLCLSNWDFAKVNNVRDMFKNCDSLCYIETPKNISANVNYIPVLPNKFYNATDKNDVNIYFDGTSPYSFATSQLKLGRAFEVTFDQNEALNNGTTYAVAIFGSDFFRTGLADNESSAIELVNPIGSLDFAGWTATKNDVDFVIDANKSYLASSPYTNENGKWGYANSATLFAKWGVAKRYSITFDLNGAQGTAQVAYVSYGENTLYESETGTSPLNLSVPQWEKHAFNGWYSNNVDDILVIDKNGNIIPNVSLITNADAQWIISSNIYLYADWTSLEFLVTFDKHGGIGGDDTATVVIGDSLPQIATPTLIGNNFGGYFTEENGQGTQYYNAEGVGIKAWDIDQNTTLHAYWTKVNYIVTFEKHGGTGGDNETTAVYGETLPQIGIPNLTGSTFAGYFTEENGQGTQYYNADGVGIKTWDIDENATLHAYWTKVNYIVTFEKHGGTGGDNETTAVYGETLSRIETPSLIGHTFAGYFTEEDGQGTQYYNADGVGIKAWDIDQNTTLHAYWIKINYIISFEKHGGTGGDNETTAVYGETLPQIGIPNLTGSNFRGYFTEEDGQGTQYYNADGVGIKAWDIDENATLHAYWIKINYIISFEKHGGTGGDNETTAVYGETLSRIETPSLVGHTFAGYFTEENGQGTQYYNADGVGIKAWDIDENTTLHAYWTEVNYIVTFEKHGGMGGDDTITAIFGAALPQIEIPNLTGRSFAGYFTEEDGQGTQYYNAEGVGIKAWDIDQNTTLHAYWIKINYIISFEKHGGTGGDNETTAVYGETLSQIGIPNLTGSSFAGYFTEENGQGTQYYNADGVGIKTWDIDENTTLHAYWTKVNYIVTFEKHGGTGGDNKTTAVYGEILSQIATPSLIGHTFAGYFTEEDGQGTQYYNADGVGVKNWDIESNITLHSYWLLNTYTIQFESNGGDVCQPISAKYQEQISLPQPNRQGYTFNGWFDKQIGIDGSVKCEWVKMPALDSTTIMLYADWIVGESTKYTVIHKQMELDGENYKVIEIEPLFGATDSTVTPKVKSYEGFTSPTEKTLHVLADGSATLEYKYVRNKYNFSLGSHVGVDTMGSTPSGEIYFGAEIVLNATEKNGYSWKQWSDGSTERHIVLTMPSTNLNISPVVELIEYKINYILNGGSLTTTKNTYNIESNFVLDNPQKRGYNFAGWTGANGNIPQIGAKIEPGLFGDIAYIANWAPSDGMPYVVEHYKMDIDGVNYSLFDSETFYGKTDELVSPYPEQYEGFTSPTEIISIKISSNEDTVIRYYYTRNKYKITWNNFDNQMLQESICFYEDTPVYQGTPTRVSDAQYDYEFSGWSPSISAVDGDKTYTATYKTTIKKYSYTLRVEMNVVDVPEIEVYVNNEQQSMQNGSNVFEFNIDYGVEITPVISLTATGQYNMSWAMAKAQSINTSSIKDEAFVITQNVEKALFINQIFEIGLNVNNDKMGYVERNSIKCLIGTNVQINAFEKKGFKFVNWVAEIPTPSSSNFVIGNAYSKQTNVQNVQCSGNVTANFDYEVYKIILNINDETQEIQYNIDTDDFVLPIPEVEGKQFEGWITNTQTPQKEVTIKKGSTGDMAFRAYFAGDDENKNMIIIIASASAAAVAIVTTISIVAIKKKKRRKPRIVNLDKFKLK